MNFINRFNKNFLFILFFLVLFNTFSLITYAQVTGGGPKQNFETINNPIAADNVQDLVKDILEGVIRIGIPLIALAIIYSGFLFVTAIGNPGKVEEAKNALLNTVIGAAILLGAWGLAQLISETVLSL